MFGFQTPVNGVTFLGRTAMLGSGATFDIVTKGTGLTLDLTTSGAGSFPVSAAVPNNGGTGYAANDIVTTNVANTTTAATIRIDTVAAGVVTGVTVLTGGSYTADPAGTGKATTYASTGFFQIHTATVNAAGRGYAVGDVETIGIGTTYAKLTVATLAGTGIATVTVTTAGDYTGSDPAGTGVASKYLFTPNPLARKTFVRAKGGGAGGGGAPSTDGSHLSGGAGGGEGGYCEKWIAAASIGTNQLVTVGKGGVGNSGANGDAGGNTTFGSILTATGGGAGGAGSSRTTTYSSRDGTPGAGGVPTGGDLNITGMCGDYGYTISSNSFFGSGGGSSDRNQGNSADNTGGGGCGVAYGGVSAPALTGGNGGSGYCIIDEFG